MTVTLKQAHDMATISKHEIDYRLTKMKFEISLKNIDIVYFAESLLECLDPAIWVLPASTSHHLEDERGFFGVLMHTERVFETVKVLCNIFNIKGRDRDWLLCAAIFHDCTKRGINCDMDYTDSCHPITVRELYMREKERKSIPAPDDVGLFFSIVEKHMGRWGYDKKESPDVPQVDPRLGDTINLSILLHMADVINSKLCDILEDKTVTVGER